MKEAVIIFVRKPILGRVKTRLAATIGNEAALSVYKKLLQHTYDVTSECTASKFVFYDEEIVAHDRWSQPGFCKRLQAETDLGQRMHTALKSVFAEGYGRVIIIRQ